MGVHNILFFPLQPKKKNIDSKSTRNGIFERPPSVATVQSLSLMAIYEGISSGENSIESTWALMGLACKLAQSVSFFLSLFFFFLGGCVSDWIPLWAFVGWSTYVHKKR